MKTKLLTLFAALLCSTTMFAYDLWVNPLAFNLNAETQTAEVTYQAYDTYWHDYNQGRSIVTANIPETVVKDNVTYTVTSIGDHAFENCEKLTSVTIPNTVTSIGRYAFESCEKLAEVTIPNSVVTIGDYAFKDCYGVDTTTEPGTTLKTGLRTVTIGSGVTSIGVCAFYECSNLTAINVSSENLNFSSDDGVLMSKYKKILITYPSGKEKDHYNIPGTVTTIKAWAFQGGGLKGITIPYTVTVIEDHAFNNCYGLQRDADGMRYADTYLIEGSANATSCTVKDGTRWIGYHAFSGCNKLTSVSIPNSVTAIGSLAFRNCTSLSWLYIPETVANINSLAFQNVPVIEYYGTATGGPWGAKKWIGGTKEVYTVFDRSVEPRTLTYYYDNRRTSRSGVRELYDTSVSRFDGINILVEKAVIDPSMKDAPLTSMERMFSDGDNPLSNMTVIEGLENLNTANVTKMQNMFDGCSSLKVLDLSSFNIDKLTSCWMMFYGCSSLTTIFCSQDWSVSPALVGSGSMFVGCNAIVGGQGTTYKGFDVNIDDKTYARPDGGPDAPGYFTETKTEVYTEFDAATGTLTYYYDGLRHTRSGVTEVYDPVNHPWATRFESYHNDVTNAVIDPSMANANLTSLNCLFSGSSNSLINLATIKGLEHLNTANVTDMCGMFFCCFALKKVDISTFNTDKLTKTDEMFHWCNQLTTIYCNDDWSAKLTSSDNMFSECTLLRGGTWPITYFDGEKTDGTYARPCDDTASGYFTNTKNEMYTAFDESTGILTYYFDDRRQSRSGKIELFSFGDRFEGYNDKVRKAVIDPSMKNATTTSLDYMFNDPSNSLLNMTAIEGLENLNTAVVESMSCMFKDCSSLKVLDLTSFNIDNLKTAYTMFYRCTSLTTIFCNQDWSLNTELVAKSGLYVFTSCTNLVGGKGTKNNNPEVGFAYARPDGGPNSPGLFTMKEAMVYTVFDEATGTLTYRYDDQFDVGNPYVEFYDPVNAPSAVRFTDYYQKVKKAVIDPSMKNANLTSTESMFFGGIDTHINNLPNMTTIEGLDNLNTANVTNMSMMFMSCVKLQTLDVSSFDVSKVTNMMLMFSDCKELMTIFCNSNWAALSAVTQSTSMFHSCNMLIGGHGTNYVYGKDVAYAHPDGGEANPGYFTMRGDANGDDQVTMTDAVSIVNSILGNPAPGFNKGAANLNGDVDENGEPKVSISDAVGVLNIVKGQ